MQQIQTGGLREDPADKNYAAPTDLVSVEP